MQKKHRALIVVTSHATLAATGRPTGYYLPEVTHPYMALVEHGIAVDIASPAGGKAPMDPQSFDLADAMNKAFWDNPATRAQLNNTYLLSRLSGADYGVIIFAGGHGTMWDFPDDAAIQRIAHEIYENGGMIAAVCHGPAALLNIKDMQGKYLIDGCKLTGFSNEEEELVHMTKHMPFLLQSALIKHGADYKSSKPWQPNVVQDRRIITGQNPASAYMLGEMVAKNLISV